MVTAVRWVSCSRASLTLASGGDDPTAPATSKVSLSIPYGVHVFDIQRTFFTEERPVETA